MRFHVSAKRGIAEQRLGCRDVASRQEHGGRCRPFGLEKFLQALDGVGHAREQRMAMLGIVDGRLQNLPQPHGAMISQQHHPGVERAGDDRCQQAVAGNELQALAPIMLDGGAGRSRALARTAPRSCASAPNRKPPGLRLPDRPDAARPPAARNLSPRRHRMRCRRARASPCRRPSRANGSR